MRDWIPRAVWVVALLLVIASARPGLSQGAAPLVVSSQSVGPSARAAGWSGLHLELTNESKNRITAYVLLVRYTDPSGKPVRMQGTMVTLMGMAPPPAVQDLAPGSATEVTMNVPQSKQGASYDVRHVSVDYVLFSSGSSWGPDTAKESLKIAGMKAGWFEAVAALRQMMSDKGLGAVQNYLGTHE